MSHSMLDAIRSLANANQYKGLISTKQLIVVNRILEIDFPERSGRITFLAHLFNRSNIHSSKDLTVSEASALIGYMYVDNWEISPYWTDFARSVREEMAKK